MPTSSGIKIQNYYTPQSRESTSRPSIDIHGRSAQLKSKPVTVGAARVLLRYLLVLFAVGTFGYLMILDIRPVVIVDGLGPKIHSSSIYEASAQRILGSSIFFRFKPSFSSDAFAVQMKSAHPELRHTYVNIDLLGRRPIVHLTEAPITFTYQALGSEYAITEEGVVAGEAKDFDIPTDTPLIRDQSGVSVTKGERVMRSDDAEFYRIATEVLRLKGRGVSYIVLSDKPREAELHLKDKIYYIKVFLEDSSEDQVALFMAAEKTLGEGGVVPQEYIDVRAGEKVFWK